MIRQLRALLEPLRQRVLLMIARGVVRLVDDATRLQVVQTSLLAGELRDQVERFQQYGFTSVPHEGAEAVVVFLGGNRSHGLAISVDDRRYRLKNLQPGDVALYTSNGEQIVLQRAGIITLKPTGHVRIEGDLVVTGDVLADGEVADQVTPGTGASMEQMRNTYNVHHHGNNNPPETPMA